MSNPRINSLPHSSIRSKRILYLSLLIPSALFLLLGLFTFDPQSFGLLLRSNNLKILELLLWLLAGVSFVKKAQIKNLFKKTRFLYYGLSSSCFFLLLSLGLQNHSWQTLPYGAFYLLITTSFIYGCLIPLYLVINGKSKKAAFCYLPGIPIPRVAVWFAFALLLLITKSALLSQIGEIVFAYCFFLVAYTSETEATAFRSPEFPHLVIVGSSVILLMLLFLPYQNAISEKQSYNLAARNLIEGIPSGDISRVIQGLAHPQIDSEFLNEHQLLLFAVESGNLENLQLLLAEGANPNFSRTGGQSPLTLAIEKAEPETILSLLAAGANPYLRDSRGIAPEEAALKVNNSFALKALEQAYQKESN